MDRGAWWAIAHRVTKSWTRLSNFTVCFTEVCVTYRKLCTFSKCSLMGLGISPRP